MKAIALATINNKNNTTVFMVPALSLSYLPLNTMSPTHVLDEETSFAILTYACIRHPEDGSGQVLLYDVVIHMYEVNMGL